MRVVSFMSLKGGVGKTTLSVNVAARLARDKFTTLLVDLEGLSASKYIFLPDEMEVKVKRTLYEILRSRISRGIFEPNPSDAVVRAPDRWEPYLYVLPGGRELEKINSMVLAERFPAWGRLLADLLERLKPRYKFIVLDCPPSQDFNPIMVMALAASDLCIVPLEPTRISYDRTLEAISSISDWKKKGVRAPEPRVVFNKVDSRTIEHIKLTDKASKELSGLGIDVFNVKLGFFPAPYSKSAGQCVPLYSFRGDYRKAVDQFESFYEELRRKIGL